MYRKEELARHLEKGDFDEDENLISLHPFCSFCRKNFFNEDAFILHLKRDHFKCDICKGEAQKYVYYNRYPNLQIHFNMSHFACSYKECLSKGMVVFETKEELEKHLNEHNNIRTAKKTNLFENMPTSTAPPPKIVDNEGVDFSGQLLSLQKIVQRRVGPTHNVENYSKKISYLDLLDLLVDEKIKSIDEERDILDAYSKMGKKSKKGFNKDEYAVAKEVFFEDVRFARTDAREFVPFADFEDALKKVLFEREEKDILRAASTYTTGKYKPADLLGEFSFVFGPVLFYKYAYMFARTLKQADLRAKLIEEIERQLGQLPFRNKNILIGVKNWKDLFFKISDEISRNILNRIEKQEINLKGSYKINKLRLFQMIHSLKTLTLREVICMKYLTNFLQKNEAKAILMRSLLVPHNRVQEFLYKIDHLDMLIMFVYFNIVELLLEEKLKISDKTHFNPNLLRLFLRHYPDFAKKSGYSLLSDEEDYCDKQNAKSSRKNSSPKNANSRSWEDESIPAF